MLISVFIMPSWEGMVKRHVKRWSNMSKRLKEISLLSRKKEVSKG